MGKTKDIVEQEIEGINKFLALSDKDFNKLFVSSMKKDKAKINTAINEDPKIFISKTKKEIDQLSKLVPAEKITELLNVREKLFQRVYKEIKSIISLISN